MKNIKKQLYYLIINFNWCFHFIYFLLKLYSLYNIKINILEWNNIFFCNFKNFWFLIYLKSKKVFEMIFKYILNILVKVFYIFKSKFEK